VVRGRKKAINGFDIFNVLFFIVLCLIMIMPFWNVLMTSVVSEGEYFSRPLILWPKKFYFGSYKYIFSSDKLIKSTAVTTFVTIVGSAYSMALTTMLSYGMTKKKMPGRNFFLTLILITMFFGGGLIPYYMLIKNLQLINTIWVMIIPSGINIWYFTLIKSFFNQIPESLEESAKIDGANEITVFFRIILPLSLPALATFSLFYGVAYWNTWYNALLFITNEDLHPLQMVLRKMIVQNERPGLMDAAYKKVTGHNFALFDDGIKMATVVVATVPILCVYPFLQKYFVQGIFVGSIKG
jgi:putative aldouronate transport system permease protein